jgi:hypothetical protein
MVVVLLVALFDFSEITAVAIAAVRARSLALYFVSTYAHDLTTFYASVFLGSRHSRFSSGLSFQNPE